MPELLREAAQALRPRLREKDVVLSIEPSWVVILASADHDGMQAIPQRLQASAQEWAKGTTKDVQNVAIPTGIAIFPTDGRNAATLLAVAAKRAAPEANPPSLLLRVSNGSPA